MDERPIRVKRYAVLKLSGFVWTWPKKRHLFTKEKGVTSTRMVWSTNMAAVLNQPFLHSSLVITHTKTRSGQGWTVSLKSRSFVTPRLVPLFTRLQEWGWGVLPQGEFFKSKLIKALFSLLQRPRWRKEGHSTLASFYMRKKLTLLP